MFYDVLIVGGGPAGLAAALTLGRGCRRVLLCDSGPRRNAAAVEMHNFVTRDGTPPKEFRRIAREQLAEYPNVEARDVRGGRSDHAHAGGHPCSRRRNARGRDDQLRSRDGGVAMHAGSCLCGAVTFEVDGELPGPDACHCTKCRKHSGHYFVSTDVPKKSLTVRGEVKWFQSSEKVRRGICPTCGSSLFWEPVHKDFMGVAMGAFDGPTKTKVRIHIFVADTSSCSTACGRASAGPITATSCWGSSGPSEASGSPSTRRRTGTCCRPAS